MLDNYPLAAELPVAADVRPSKQVDQILVRPHAAEPSRSAARCRASGQYLPSSPEAIMRRLLTLAFAAALSLYVSDSQAQEAAYHPSRKNPRGPEVVAVFITQSTCIWSNREGFDQTIARMKHLLAQRTAAQGEGLAIRGVALDWDARTGMEYLLQRFGEFDELAAGRNWFSTDAAQHIWRAEGGRASTPQVILFRRTVQPGGRSMEFGPDRKVAHLFGVDEITRWVAAGAPIAADSAAPAQ